MQNKCYETSVNFTGQKLENSFEFVKFKKLENKKKTETRKFDEIHKTSRNFSKLHVIENKKIQ